MKITLDRAKLLPFSLTLVIIALDQTIKSIIVKNWPIEGTFIHDLFGNGLVQFWHVRNRAIAFSLGYNLPDSVRPILFVVLPVIVLVILLWYYFASSNFLTIQRWAIAGILGGGLGNIIDRIFRQAGVVDYVSVKFYGIFGWDRWPTFNLADSSVVICCIILLVSIIINSGKEA
ncbi:MAG: signal peptidase II [Treponema sp.]|nr:signal peptidase II [Treponema sp.]